MSARPATRPRVLTLGVASCTPVIGTALNGWTETQCATLTTSGGTATCTPQTANAGNSYVDITCNNVTVGPALTATCTPAVAGPGNSWTATTCGTVTTGPTLVGSCVPQAANAGNNFVETTCTTTPGSKISYATTTTVSTQLSSGGIPVGPPTVTVTTGPATDLNGVCYAPGRGPGAAGAQPAARRPGGRTLPARRVRGVALHGEHGQLGRQHQLARRRRAVLLHDRPAAGADARQRDAASALGPEDDRATLAAHDHLHGRPRRVGNPELPARLQELRHRHRRLRRHPHRRQELAGVAGPCPQLRPGNGRQLRQLEQPEVDRRLLAHRSQRPRHVLQRQAGPTSVVTGLADALADVEVRTGSGSGITGRTSTPVDGDNFALHDDLHHRQVDRRRAGIQHRRDDR